jgi:mannosyl-oligosaccharide alpha-1,2-mannosidase
LTGWASGLSYFATVVGEQFSHDVTHLGFFVPGMLFLASKFDADFAEEYLRLAKELLRTAVRLYTIQPTGLGGETARFVPRWPGVVWIDDTFKLRPELVESLFYSWRVTHDFRAREEAWKILMSIRKYCETEGGYTTIHDTSDGTVMYDDMQDSFFLSETLKYLYLMFSDDDVYSLDEYVFTTQAHPLRRLKYSNQSRNM